MKKVFQNTKRVRRWKVTIEPSEKGSLKLTVGGSVNGESCYASTWLSKNFGKVNSEKIFSDAVKRCVVSMAEISMIEKDKM